MSDFNANDSQHKSWIETDSKSDFSIQNIPFGIVKKKDGKVVAASRIGDTVIDLHSLSENGFFRGLEFQSADFASCTLNQMMRKGKKATTQLRNRIAEIFESSNTELKDRSELHTDILSSIEDCQNLMPVEIGDYTDFYSSIEHATNVGTMFRDPNNALLPNWKHIPVGYHGRSSSIILSGQEIHRPKGQQKPKDDGFCIGICRYHLCRETIG